MVAQDCVCSAPRVEGNQPAHGLRCVPAPGITCLHRSSAKGPLQQAIQCHELIPCPTLGGRLALLGVLFLTHPNHVPAGWPVPSSPRGAGTRGWKGFVNWGPLGKVGLSSGSPCSAQAAWPANSYSTSRWHGIQRQTQAGLKAGECRGFRVGEGLAQASRGGRAAFLSSQVCSTAAVYHEQRFSFWPEPVPSLPWP